MKEKTLYTCETCHTDYSDKTTAKQCENSHKTKLKIVSKRYKPFRIIDDGFPISITLADETGKEMTFRR